ncbi:ribosome small subunit-dependent GTPase A [Plebeiibacterium sediminum]|uniref:Small ribosomal subunit biogenesis GTPase RsgA n=1 Tax=Plebeiibacterium sediminum TaxID=2992112 RepID=A0AAE3M5X2_9BACT|nr:ribosome small subunit-dependent GTPase A [Plebeiobacterium sediminum]MCW3787512.1 ribosome small subunit-dependent GTPase A [Plebeiobacterium sediminum]
MSERNYLLYQLGFTSFFEEQLKENNDLGLDIARITSEHKERYTVKSEYGESEGEVIGNLRFAAESRADFPVVGDWVLVSSYDEGKVLIHKVLKRKNILRRQAVNRESEVQIIAANIDYAFIVESVNRDFSINRFERYITLCYDAGIEPILVLNKSDLINDQELIEIQNTIKQRIANVSLIISSCISNDGISEIEKFINPEKTYCFLGSSGVGKSTLINLISHKEILKTNVISELTQRGKHTTTHRELILLENGGVLIDNPGMREVGIADASKGLDQTFFIITELAHQCKYRDCTHHDEDGCAVIEALNKGELDADSYQNYLKMFKENQHYQSSEIEKKQKGKRLSKHIKQFKNRKDWH